MPQSVRHAAAGLLGSALVGGALCGAAAAGLALDPSFLAQTTAAPAPGFAAPAAGLVAPAVYLPAPAAGLGPPAAGRGTTAPVLLPAATRPAAQSSETLAQSIERRRVFPFRPNCEGNTQELVACLWQRRDQLDGRLLELLGGSQELEGWRSARHGVCRRPAERGLGGSIRPILWFSCENALNTSLLQQLTPRLGP